MLFIAITICCCCYYLPNARTHLYCPLRTSSLASIRADDADEQLLFVLNTGTPVRPSSDEVNNYSDKIPTTMSFYKKTLTDSLDIFKDL